MRKQCGSPGLESRNRGRRNVTIVDSRALNGWRLRFTVAADKARLGAKPSPSIGPSTVGLNTARSRWPES
jgi:hypothetical protein